MLKFGFLKYAEIKITRPPPAPVETPGGMAIFSNSDSPRAAGKLGHHGHDYRSKHPN
jgi:hypothetical protein